MIFTTQFDSPMGIVSLAAKDDALVGLWLAGQTHFLLSNQEEIFAQSDAAALMQAKDWLVRYFGGEKPSVTELRLSPKGSAFDKRVWAILCEIPYGETVSYGAIAKRIAKERGLVRMSAQAVGGAVGRNPISIIIPCHRVVGANGSLTGYAGGIEKKIWLLSHEGHDRTKFTVPKEKQQNNRMSK